MRWFLWSILAFWLTFPAQAHIIPVIEALQWEITPQDNHHFTLTFTLCDNCLLYRDKLTLSGPPLSFEYPPAELQPDIDTEPTWVYRHSVSFVVHYDHPEPIQLRYQGCTTTGLCYPPQEVDIPPELYLPTEETPLENVMERSLLAKPFTPLSLLGFFGLGLLLAFTPCVLPMLPILAGILGGETRISPKRAFYLSLTYVLSMSLTYALAGLAASFLGYTLQNAFKPPSLLGFFPVFYCY